MRILNKQFSEKVRPWRATIICAAALTIIWVAFGIVLGSDFVDKHFEYLKILETDNSLAYLAAALGVQIPVFILFLETMKKSGYVYKKVLPEITEFREILVVLFLSATFIVFSPSASYLYSVVGIFILITIIALFRAINIIFQLETSDHEIRNSIRKAVESSFRILLNNRISDNEHFAWIKEHEDYEISFLEKEGNRQEILSNTDGFMRKVQLDKLDKNFQRIKKRHLKKNPEQKLTLSFATYPSQKVTKDTTIALLVSEPKLLLSKREIRKIRKCIRIEERSYKVKWLFGVLEEFDNQLAEGVKNNNPKLITDTLDLYSSVTDKFDDMVQKKMITQDENYSLSDAHSELRSNPFASGEDLGKTFNRLHDILFKNLLDAIKYSRQEAAHELISEVYGLMLNMTYETRLSASARYDEILTGAVGSFIFTDVWNKELTAIQEQLREELFFKLKEHTTFINYRFKEAVKKSKEESTHKNALRDRINKVRELALVAYKNNKFYEFEKLIEILKELNNDNFHQNDMGEMAPYLSANILLIAAYIKHKNDLDSEYGKLIKSMIDQWSPQKLLDTTILCADKDYADAWRINTFDLAHDGQMHSVPSYDLVLKNLWVDQMIESGNVPVDASYFGDTEKYQNTLFFTNASSTDENNDLFNIIGELNTEPKKQLRGLIESFIKIRRDYEAEILTAATLDQEKVSNYIQKVNEGFKKNSLVLQVFKGRTHYAVDRSTNDENYKQIGINQIFDKEAFIEKWHIGFGMDYTGEHTGTNIAQGQDRNVFSEMLKDHVTFPSIENALVELKKYSGEWLVFINKAYNFEFRKGIDKILTSDSTYDNQFVKGIRQQQPIHRIHSKDLPGGLYFIKKKDIGKIFRKNEKTKNFVEVDITAYSDDKKLLEGLLKLNPEWLQKKGSIEDQTKFLNQKVRMWVMHIYKYVPVDNKIVLFVSFDDPE